MPACGLLAGAVVGLLLPEIPISVYGAAFAAAVAIAFRAWSGGRGRWLVASVCLAFFAGGAMLSDHAARSAFHPSLRAAFDELARTEREALPADARRRPEDPTATAALVGVLRADAVPTPFGASLSVDVDQVWMPCPREVDGGVLLTVIGDSARSGVDRWRAGRTAHPREGQPLQAGSPAFPARVPPGKD